MARYLTAFGRPSFLLGCNYWSRAGGPRMWEDARFSLEQVESEMRQMRAMGMNACRAFTFLPTFMPKPPKVAEAPLDRLHTLFELAARSDDAGTRVAAIDASMAAIERDANLQSSIDKMLTGLDDQSLAMMIRSSAGERANELMSRVLSRTRRPEFRQRVVNMLRALRDTQS